GGQEFHLPALNPIELWEETDRVKAFGDIMFHVKNRAMVLAPTHEEVITSIAKNHVKSYKDMPQIWYQIQTKFRNEPRPKSGVLRGRQFTMKDSYSMDSSQEGLNKSYDLHAQAYRNIYTRCGLTFYVVGASSGAMGGSGSQEFMVESNAGEDNLAVCTESGYAANVEIATSSVPKVERFPESKPFEKVHTPNAKTIDEVAAFLKMPTTRCAKSLVFMNGTQPVIVLMLGNDQLNESKLHAVFGTDTRPAHPEELISWTGADAGSIGPVGLDGKFTIVADMRLEGANGLVCGANQNDYHLVNVDLNRDAKIQSYHDFRTVEEGEMSPDGKGKLRVVKGIEVGHIFKLGTKYSVAMKANFLDEKGGENPIIMGSYGIGVERIVACHIEQHHDEFGIKWQKSIAPYDVHLISVNMNSEMVKNQAEAMYAELLKEGISVLYDDRSDVTAGFKFKDADLLGMPLHVIVGEKNLKNNEIELKDRNSGKRWNIPVSAAIEEIVKFVKE
ncbi:MAG: proline--tRNA ligase, partial [Ignavibacteriales bacterium]|nr:proline--tRNA ligase [Ignavibacteriales bacterium]